MAYKRKVRHMPGLTCDIGDCLKNVSYEVIVFCLEFNSPTRVHICQDHGREYSLYLHKVRKEQTNAT